LFKNKGIVVIKKIPVIIIILIIFSCTYENKKDLIVLMLGDSTVSDYSLGHESRGWGQLINEYMTNGVKIVNVAKPGATTYSCLDEFFDEGLSRNGDYYFIQFGHNDLWQENPLDEYREDIEYMIEQIRTLGAVPVLVSPMQMLHFKEDGTLQQNLKPYVEKIKETARENSVLFIDLFSISDSYFTSIGEEESMTMTHDYIHFNEKGAYVLAGFIIDEMKKLDSEFSNYIK